MRRMIAILGAGALADRRTGGHLRWVAIMLTLGSVGYLLFATGSPALLLAGLPHSVPGETVNRLCASGMSAIAASARAAKLGDGDLFVAGGVESMTRAPFVLSKAAKPWARDVEIFDTSLGWRFVNPKMRERDIAALTEK